SPKLGYFDKLDAEVEAVARNAVEAFSELGAIVEEADPGFPDPSDRIRAFWGAVSSVIVDAVPFEHRAKMDPDFVRLAEAGRRYSVADFLAAYQHRAELAHTMLR